MFSTTFICNAKMYHTLFINKWHSYKDTSKSRRMTTLRHLHCITPLRSELATLVFVGSNLVSIEVLGPKRNEYHKEPWQGPHFHQACQ